MTTKIHAVVDANDLLCAIALATRHQHDSVGPTGLLSEVQRIGMVLANKTNDADAIRKVECPVTLGDLIREGKLLWCYCRRCGRERDADPATIPLAPELPVPDAGTRMRCSACGSRQVETKPELYPGWIEAMRAGTRVAVAHGRSDRLVASMRAHSRADLAATGRIN